MRRLLVGVLLLTTTLAMANSKFIYFGGNINIVDDGVINSLERIKFISPNLNIGYGGDIKLTSANSYFGYNIEFGQQTFTIGYGSSDAPRSYSFEIKQNYISGILEFGKKFTIPTKQYKIILGINTEIKYLISNPYASYSDPAFTLITSVYEKMESITPVQFLIGITIGLDKPNFNFKLFVNYCINGIDEYFDYQPYKYFNIKTTFGFKL